MSYSALRAAETYIRSPTPSLNAAADRSRSPCSRATDASQPSPAGIAFAPGGVQYASQYSYDLEPGRAHSGKGQIVRIDVSKPVATTFADGP
jgi:hypothetical protein